MLLSKIADTPWIWRRGLRNSFEMLRIALQNSKPRLKHTDNRLSVPSNGFTKFTRRSRIDFSGRARIVATRHNDRNVQIVTNDYFCAHDDLSDEIPDNGQDRRASDASAASRS